MSNTASLGALLCSRQFCRQRLLLAIGYLIRSSHELRITPLRDVAHDELSASVSRCDYQIHFPIAADACYAGAKIIGTTLRHDVSTKTG